MRTADTYTGYDLSSDLRYFTPQYKEYHSVLIPMIILLSILCSNFINFSSEIS